MKMNPLNIYIILPGLFGVCPQTRRVFFRLIKEVNFMNWGSLREKVIRHLWKSIMSMGLKKEGKGRLETRGRLGWEKRGE